MIVPELAADDQLFERTHNGFMVRHGHPVGKSKLELKQVYNGGRSKAEVILCIGQIEFV